MLEVELFRCRANKAGGNISGPTRIVEDVEFTAFKSPAYGTEVRFNLYNLTPDYSVL